MPPAQVRMPVTLRTRLTAIVAIFSLISATLVLSLLSLAVPREITAAVDAGLAERASDLVEQLDAGEQLTDPTVQLLDSSGTVLGGAARRPGAALLTAPQVAAAREGMTFGEIDVRSLGGPVRYVAVPLEAASLPTADPNVMPQSQPAVIVVVTRLQPLDSLSRRLLVGLAFGLAVLVLVAGVGCWVLVKAALHPVSAMSAAAAVMGARPGDDRLPRTGMRDEIDGLAQTLNDLLQRVQVAFDREQAFVDDASHELRTPLTLLRGELELASDETDLPSARRGILAALVAAQRLSTLTQDLLVLARQRDGAGHRPEVTPLTACLTTAVTGMGPLPLDVAVVAPDGEIEVVADPAAMARVMTNLVSNAVKAGAHRMTVTVSRPAGTADGASIDVDDDGPGFPEAFLPKAFTRFARADSARSGGGTGLGLAIVAEIVARHGGSVAADNSSGLGGARIRVELPPGKRSPTP